jgi:hypothetical protein|tara:strand:+ start:169 stop:1002 length:834 start_codon:yes stop_codon:yes gene_type:complete
MIQKLDVMSFDLWKKIVDDAVNLNIEYLDLCGFGDVFLDKGLFEKVRYAKSVKPDFKVYVSTTAIGMSKNKWKDTVELIDILKLSNYGMSKEVYEEVMGGINYDIAHRNILGFLEENKKADNKVYTVGNYIVLDENKHELDDWIKFWEARLSEVYVWKPHNYLYGRNYRDISGEKQRTCGRPLEGPLNIAVDGAAHVCCFDFNKELVVGSLKHNTIMEVLDSKEMKHIQEKHLNDDFDGLLCKICDQTVKDDSVLLYKTNSDRVVGQSNSSMYVFKS